MSYYMADTPGRLRIESPVLKNNPQKCAAFQEFVKGVGGVTSVDMKPELGSATIHYDPKVLDHTKLIVLLEKTGKFDHLQAKTPDDYLEKAIKGVAKVALDAASGGLEE
jgi:Heavy metal associated domain 2